jgi:tetratricopeptide (TPR) repeat protein
VAATLTIGLLASAAAAPPDRTADLTAEIAKAPGNPDLYVRRARIYIERAQHEAALADLEQAAELPGGVVPAAHVHAPLLLRLARAKAALEVIARARAVSPDDFGLRIYEAQGLEALGRRREAADVYAKGISTLDAPQVENYFELARLLTALGDRKSKEAALAVLERGITAIGPVVTLVFPAIDLEVGLGRWDAALAHLEYLAPQMAGRPDLLLERKVKILRSAGRAREAKQAERDAEAARASLPPHLRAQPSAAAPAAATPEAKATRKAKATRAPR